MSRWSAGSRSTNRITDRRQRCWSRFIIGAVSIDAEIAVADHLRSPIDRPASPGARRAPNEHIAELRKSAAEAAAKLKRLHDAIENGIADVSDPLLEERVTELKSVRDQARAERAAGALDRAGPSIAPQVSKPSPGGRQVDANRGGQLPSPPSPRARRAGRGRRIRDSDHGSKGPLLRTLVAASNCRFWRAQFCTEVAHPTRFERVASTFGG